MAEKKMVKNETCIFPAFLSFLSGDSEKLGTQTHHNSEKLQAPSIIVF